MSPKKRVFTHHVGIKFHPDGSVMPFSGNTVICFVAPDMLLMGQLLWMRRTLQAMACADHIGFLPPSSYHMTTFELLTDYWRQPQRWTPALPLDAPIQVTDAFFKTVVPRVPAPDAFLMRCAGVEPGTPATMRLEPANEATRTALRRYRDALAQATGIRFPNHETYGYHITLGYKLVEFDDAAMTELGATLQTINDRLRTSLPPFGLGPPCLVFFNDMTEFTLSPDR
ncbi:MAG: DUF1868 domain-containing protein [Thermoflexales bacterium]